MAGLVAVVGIVLMAIFVRQKLCVDVRAVVIVLIGDNRINYIRSIFVAFFLALATWPIRLNWQLKIRPA